MGLLRLLRLVKTVQVFDVLSLMMGSLQASATVLLWSIVLLFFIMLSSALFLQYMLEEYMLNEEHPQQDREDIYGYFGSFSRAFLTMFELTLGNWVPVTRLLNNNVSEWFGPFLLTYQALVAF